MKITSGSPKAPKARKPKIGLSALIKTDSDIVRALRFLKNLCINTVVTVLSFAIVGIGGCIIALIISLIGKALTAQSVQLPEWAHKSESWSVGVFLVLMMLLATWLVIKDVWLVGARSEAEEAQSLVSEEKESKN